jgi:hypothetical protein
MRGSGNDPASDDLCGPELRAFLRHPLTKRLNRELLEAFERDARRLARAVGQTHITEAESERRRACDTADAPDH